MQYKVGDKVRIREWNDMKEEFWVDRNGRIVAYEERTVVDDYGLRYIHERMRCYCGKETRIEQIIRYRFGYRLEIDGGAWFWPECALIPAETEKKAVKCKIGDKVKTREWDDLVAEYGVDHKGNIRPEEGIIISHMKDYCGKEAEVRFRPNFNGSYKLEIDGKYYLWPACALLPVEENVAKYKIGDKVKIREWDEMVEEYGLDRKGIIRTPTVDSRKCIRPPKGATIIPHMKDKCGKETTILSGPDLKGNYRLAIDGACWSWSECALLPVEEDVKYKIGDKVRIREWDDLVEEYGISSKGYIYPPRGEVIIPHMKDDCGKETTIECGPDSSGNYRLEVDGGCCLWSEYALLPVPGEPVETEEKNMKYEIGEKVKIKKWDEMAQEFRVDSGGSLRPKEGATVVPSMKDDCGKETTVLCGPDSSGNYRLGVDEGYYLWPKRALLPAETEETKEEEPISTECDRASDEEPIPTEDVITRAKRQTEENDMKYNVGDKVRIRTWKDLAKECGVEQNGNIYPPEGVVIVSRMKEHCGKETTIKELDPSGNYRLEVDDACCLWPEFALLEENNGKYKVGDKVRIREWDEMAEEYGLNHRGHIHQGEGEDIVPRMKDYCGEETLIKRGPDADGDYNLAIDGGRYFWSEYALLPVEEKDAKYNIGDKVKIREWDEMAQGFRVDCRGNLRPREGATIIPCMKNNCGKETTILRGPNSDGNYELAIDGGRCFWPECALLPVGEPVIKESPKKVAYISGLIAGENDDRSHAKAVLMQNGYSVINPTELRNNVLPKEMSLEDYLDVCLLLIEKADVLVQLPGWEAGAAANRELGYAKGLGKEVIKLGDIEKDCADR